MPDAGACARPARLALAELADETKAAWRLRYCGEESTEIGALGLIERTERDIRATSGEVTIQELWVRLAHRARWEDGSHVQAAVALAAAAMK